MIFLLSYGACFFVVSFALVAAIGEGTAAANAGMVAIASSIVFHGIAQAISSGDITSSNQQIGNAIGNRQ